MNKYITIEFETGSRGLEISERVAEALSLPCYGREILQQVAEDQNLTQHDMREYVGTLTDSLLFSYYIMSQANNDSTSGLPQEGIIYCEQRKKIKELAKKGSAVFAGQCAVRSVKEFGTVTRVFIKASYEDREKNITEKITTQNYNAETIIKRMDAMQERYYFCTGNRQWRDPNEYDLIIDSSKYGIDGCVKAIKEEYMRTY